MEPEYALSRMKRRPNPFPKQLKKQVTIVDALNDKNKLDQLRSDRLNSKTPDIINHLTENPIEVNGFLTRE